MINACFFIHQKKYLGASEMVRVDQSILRERNDSADLKKGFSARNMDLGRFSSKKPAEMNEDTVP